MTRLCEIHGCQAGFLTRALNHACYWLVLHMPYWRWLYPIEFALLPRAGCVAYSEDGCTKCNPDIVPSPYPTHRREE